MRDDAAVLLLRPGQKSRNIFERHQRNVEAVTEAHKARAFDAGVDVQHSRQKCGLIGYDPHRLAVQAGKADDHVLGVMLLHFEEVAVIHDGVDHLADIVGQV